MKKAILCISLMLLAACSNSNNTFSDEEITKLKDLGVYEQVESSCDYNDTVKYMLKHNYNKEYTKDYCAINTTSLSRVNTLLELGYTRDEINSLLNSKYYIDNNFDRYINDDEKNIKQRILNINMNLDLEAYSKINTIEDDSVITLLVNKYNGLKEGYEPDDLVEIDYACKEGIDYSCSTDNKKRLRKEAADAFKKWGDAAKKENINLVAIGMYRTYSYQAGLYSYGANTYGQKYADQYYARPGHSEHNTGLAVDISFNNVPYTSIDSYDEYDWIIENAHKYGFILRYPEDKTAITKFSYESWHFRYVGKEAAKYIYKNDITLEEYHALNRGE